MKTKNLVVLFTLIFVLTFTLKSYSQFEQKFTLQASGGLVKPLGDIGDAFSSGLSVDAGVQYNYSRRLAFVGLIKYVVLYPQDENDESQLNSLGISVCPKYRFFPDSKVNPYVLGGVGLFLTTYSYPDIANPSEYIDSRFPTSFGYTASAGVDVSINDNISLFFQSGYSSTILNDEGYNVNFNSLYFQIGINISFIKSKAL